MSYQFSFDNTLGKLTQSLDMKMKILVIMEDVFLK